MSRADLHSAAYAARNVLAAIVVETDGGRGDALEPLAMLNRALRGDDSPVWLASAATVLCMLEPGYGSPIYRGAPVPAVALQQEAERVASDANRETARRLVRDDVYCNVSHLVASLMSNACQPDPLIDEETAEALAGRPAGVDEMREELPDHYVCEEVADSGGDMVWRWYDSDAEETPDVADSFHFDDEEEALRDLYESERLDMPDGSEAFEHWIVSNWLAEKLRAMGESVADDVQGLTVWARCTTGQAIAMDWTFQRIASDLNADAERAPTEAELIAARDAVAAVASGAIGAEAERFHCSKQFEALSRDPVSHYRNAANVFAIACKARFGFDPRDVLS